MDILREYVESFLRDYTEFFGEIIESFGEILESILRK